MTITVTIPTLETDRLVLRALLISTLMMAPSLAAAERVLECDTSTLMASLEVLELPFATFSEDADGTLSVTFYTMGATDSAPREPLLLTHTSNSDTQGDRFSTVVIEDTLNVRPGTPVVYHIDWDAPTLFRTSLTVDPNEPVKRNAAASIYTSSGYTCRRMQ